MAVKNTVNSIDKSLVKTPLCFRFRIAREKHNIDSGLTRMRIYRGQYHVLVNTFLWMLRRYRTLRKPSFEFSVTLSLYVISVVISQACVTLTQRDSIKDLFT
ncbi:hypothetical protein HOLleu_13450 [Holothuria leucospilota]|uniref:Uncharacterized protein n=1 Tax=Holothuria leucospilota TaxID=206669 RepID=A0A9Q1HAV4_HOLLE|nr:hypothetical protein HOLleu_13450 [Holothuria leucospilota]